MRLVKIIADGLHEVETSATSTLSLGRRMMIWEEMNRCFPESAAWRRVLINVYTVMNSALPLWVKAFGEDTQDLPHQFLGICGRRLYNTLSANECRQIITQNCGQGYLSDEDFGGDEDKFWAAYSIDAAERAAWVAGLDEACLVRRSGITQSMIVHPDPDEWDAHYVCSAIAAGGLEEIERSSAVLRRNFWIRWLNGIVTDVCQAETTVDQLQSRHQDMISLVSSFPIPPA